MSIAALLVVGFGLAGAVAYSHAGDKVAVLQVATLVTKGHTITSGDLASVDVSGVPGAIPAVQSGSVVGRTAAVDLVPQTVLTEGMLTGSVLPGAGQSMVGLALDASQAPTAGLADGDVVSVIAVPGQDSTQATQQDLETPLVLAAAATVYSVSGAGTQGGQILLTLVVPQTAAARVAAYGSAGRVAVIEIPAAGLGH
jgi:hypothetical protein